MYDELAMECIFSARRYANCFCNCNSYPHMYAYSCIFHWKIVGYRTRGNGLIKTSEIVMIRVIFEVVRISSYITDEI